MASGELAPVYIILCMYTLHNIYLICIHILSVYTLWSKLFREQQLWRSACGVSAA
jgi:hypothetical protein